MALEILFPYIGFLWKSDFDVSIIKSYFTIYISFLNLLR
jgi:hypothetical protein